MYQFSPCFSIQITPFFIYHLYKTLDPIRFLSHAEPGYQKFGEDNHRMDVLSTLLTHSYYFTIGILVLKFLNKGVFFEKIQDSHFPRKRGYFSTHLHECGVKGVNFDVQCFTVKKGVHLGWKIGVLLQKKGVHFELKSQCFIAKKGSFWAEKSVFCHKKGGHFHTGEQGWVLLFQWMRELGLWSSVVSHVADNNIIVQYYSSVHIRFTTKLASET